jgi:hypothetical protein
VCSANFAPKASFVTKLCLRPPRFAKATQGKQDHQNGLLVKLIKKALTPAFAKASSGRRISEDFPVFGIQYMVFGSR